MDYDSECKGERRARANILFVRKMRKIELKCTG